MPEVKAPAPAIVEELPRAVGPIEACWPAGICPSVPALQVEMDRILDTFWYSFGGVTPALLQSPRRFDTVLGLVMPVADVVENNEDLHSVGEPPGLSADDSRNDISDDLLTKGGKKADARTERANTYRVSERRFGSFKRSY